LRLAVLLLGAIAVLRACTLVLHDPLLALANSYDQVRYTACIDVAPLRPGVPADASNPQAPLRVYGFTHFSFASCYWTSDLLLTAPVVLGWKLAERLGGDSGHSIRTLGVLRLAVWCALGLWLTCALRQVNLHTAALVNALWLAVVAADPANTLYLNTFYAEPAALIGLYACIGSATLLAAERSRQAIAMTLLGAGVLALSKFQHVALPALLGIGLLLTCGRSARLTATLLLIGTLAGGFAAAANRHFAQETMHGISAANRADFVLSALLMNVDDPVATAARLGLPAECARHANVDGLFVLPEPYEKICSGIDKISTPRTWFALLRDPAAFARALLHTPALTLPWLPDYLGVVEGMDHGKLPSAQWSLATVFGSSIATAWVLLLAPWMVLFAVWHAGRPERAYAALCATASAAIVAIALFGEGYVDLAKHVELAFNAVLASLCLPCVWLLRRAQTIARPAAVLTEDRP
jgi:hypothetical protein